MIRNKVVALLPPVQARRVQVAGDQSVNDIMREVLTAHEIFRPDYKRIAGQLETREPKQVARELFDFCKKYIRYRVEPESLQTSRSPGVLLSIGSGDCKHYAGFIAGVLDAAGGYDWRYRFASYRLFNPDPQHVFVVLKDQKGKEIWIDPVLESLNQRSPYPNYTTDKKSSNMLERMSGVNGDRFYQGGISIAGYRSTKTVRRKVMSGIGALPTQTGYKYFLKVTPSLENIYANFPQYQVDGQRFDLPQFWARDLKDQGASLAVEGQSVTNWDKVIQLMPTGLRVIYPTNFEGKGVPWNMLRPYVMDNKTIQIHAPTDTNGGYSSSFDYPGYTGDQTKSMLAADNNRLLRLLTMATGALMMAYQPYADADDVQRLQWRIMERRDGNFFMPWEEKTGVGNFIASIGKAFTDTVKFVGKGIAAFSGFGPRNAFLILVKFNVFNLAGRLKLSLAKTGTGSGTKDDLYKKWIALGGTFSVLEDTIVAGAKNKPFISGVSMGDGGLSEAALAGIIVAATSVITALANILKSNNPDDAKLNAAVDGAVGVMNGYLTAAGYDPIAVAKSSGNKPVEVRDANGNIITVLKPNSTGISAWVQNNPMTALAAGGVVALIVMDASKTRRRTYRRA